AWTYALTGDFAAVDRLLARDPPALRAPCLPPEMVGELAVLEATVARFRGDGPRALELSRRALELLSDDQQALRGGALLNLGVVHQQRREPAAAARALDEAGRLGEAGGWGRYVALGALEELATLEIRRGQLTQAARTCGRAI